MDPQMEFFFEIFDPSLPRLGPGDDNSTHRALNTVLSVMSHRSDAHKLQILDLGCGNGAQTLQLAKQVDGTILAVDNHQPFLDELELRAKAVGLSQKIETRLGDMANLELSEPFDIIWSEGALFVMGFRAGVDAYKRHLKPKGCFAATELCWLRPDPPAECREYFASQYPAMSDVIPTLTAIQNSGYRIIGHFVLPELAWWNYYLPIEKRLQLFRQKYAADPQKLASIEAMQKEIDIYRKYSSYYGYVFYLMQS